MDITTFIGQEVKAISSLIADIDIYSPDEDLVEVLMGAVEVWGAMEAQLLIPALEIAFEDSESITGPATERLNALYALESSIHLGEGADEPFTELAVKYINAVKYHLIADIQDVLPLVLQLPARLQRDLVESMTALKSELE